MNAALFADLREVAEGALRRSVAPASHDFLHVLRVVENATRIATAEGANVEVCRVAALLHELVNLPKDHPESHTSGDLCAIEVEGVLFARDLPPSFVSAVVASVRDHAFSKGVVPDTLEAKVLQDADRLDAIGAIGVARCMATAAEMKSAFYASSDPFAKARALDDRSFALDHFQKKLFRIPERLHTATAKRLAEERMAFMRAFVDALARECGFDEPPAFPTK
jgi:uncharacterized protein